MTKMRVIETNEGIQAPPTAELFDQFAKGMRDKGWQGVDSMLASGLPAGDLLELGPGPGYVGLELAKQLRPRTLTGCDISPAMLQIAQTNAAATAYRCVTCWAVCWRCRLKLKALTAFFLTGHCTSGSGR